jgi:dephospho-CoA kinase
MFVVGLTGGIGSGKSTVATLFHAKGVPIIDADEVARKVTEPGTPALKKIIELVGADIISADGYLDRARLRNLIFSNESIRKKLEQLLHPLIRAEMKSRIETFNTPYCIAMIPLLLETDPNPLINRILIVDTSVELQITRTSTRDKMAREDIEAILKTQITRDKRLELADDVIINDNGLLELIPQVDQLHELYLSLARPK